MDGNKLKHSFIPKKTVITTPNRSYNDWVARRETRNHTTYIPTHGQRRNDMTYDPTHVNEDIYLGQRRERQVENVMVQRETTLEPLLGSGVSIEDIIKRVKYELVEELAYKLLDEELVDISNVYGDLGNTHITKIKLKILK